MPEGPELKIIKNSIKHINNLSIIDFEILPGSRYHKHGAPKKFLKFCKQFPIKILKIKVKGKFLWWQLDTKDNKTWSIWFTMGMSGRLLIGEQSKHCNIRIQLYDLDNWKRGTDKPLDIYFDDPRHFGTIRLCNDQEYLNRKIKQLGPDMMDPVTKDYMFVGRLLEHPRMGLAVAVMNQKIISGVGNYIRAESFYRARLYPFSKISEYTYEELLRLYEAIREIMVESYEYGGVNVIDASKNEGYCFQLQVYGRKTTKDGLTVEKQKTSDGRTLHWVPALQKKVIKLN